MPSVKKSNPKRRLERFSNRGRRPKTSSGQRCRKGESALNEDNVMKENVNEVDTPVPAVGINAAVQDAVTGIQTVYQLVPKIPKTPAVGFTDASTPTALPAAVLATSVRGVLAA